MRSEQWKRWGVLLTVSVFFHLFLLLVLTGWKSRTLNYVEKSAVRLWWSSGEMLPAATAPAGEPVTPPALLPTEDSFTGASPARLKPGGSEPSASGLKSANPPLASPPVLPTTWQQALEFSGRPPTFFGRPFGGRRVVFVVDISGSMLQKSGTGTRLSEAYAGLMRAVAALGAEQEFNIVLFADRVDVFMPDPVRAVRENVLRAFAYLDSGVDCGGSTNLQDALRRALAMKPDVMLLLSDGEANTEDEVILAEFRHLRQRHCPELTLHAVGFHLEPGSRAELFLQRLVADRRGSYASWRPGTTP